MQGDARGWQKTCRSDSLGSHDTGKFISSNYADNLSGLRAQAETKDERIMSGAFDSYPPKGPHNAFYTGIEIPISKELLIEV